MFRNLLTRGKARSGDENLTATGAMLRALVPNCQICKKSLQGHSFAQIATATVNDSKKPLLSRLFGAVRRHEWGRLKEFKDWDSLADNVVVYVIKGDHGDGTVLVVKNAFELYASNELILLEGITDADISSIANQLPLAWQQM